MHLVFFFFVGVILSFGFNFWRFVGFTALVMTGHALWLFSLETPVLTAIWKMFALTTTLQIGYFSGLLALYCRARMLDDSRAEPLAHPAAAVQRNVGHEHRSA